MSKILKLLERMGRKRIIMDRQNGAPLITRYYLFLKDRTWFPFNVFLHRFHQSDPGDVHDHPWPFASLILKGGYWEYTPQFNAEGKMTCEIGKWRGPGHFRMRSATSYHRIELDPTVTAWTLFMPGPQRREWGFLVKNKWVPNEQYLHNNRSN